MDLLHHLCLAIGDWLHFPIAAAAVCASAAVVDAVILVFIWMEPSGDGGLNQIFMKERKETSNSTSLLPAPAYAHGVAGGPMQSMSLTPRTPLEQKHRLGSRKICIISFCHYKTLI